MDKQIILNLLKEYESEHSEKFASYIVRLKTEKDRTGSLKNGWIQYRKEDDMANLFKAVSKEGLVFDGVHITLQKTGVSYDYVAYKNKMLLAYPESKIDVSLVYSGDKIEFAKESGQVGYTHNIANPFSQVDADIIGAYCVIKNKRGEFLTTMSPQDIEKHRKVAKTDFIWKQWFKEMCLKTIIKKAVKSHFNDIYKGIEEMDNENFSLDNPLNIKLQWKQEIDEINDIESLRVYWVDNCGRGKEFDKYVKIRKEQINKDTNEDS